MKTFKALNILLVALLVASCDYNDKYFDGYDDITIADKVSYVGEFTGTYPSDGYFTDRTTMTTAINTMLKAKYPYVDAGSTASITVMYGDVTQGLKPATADENYTLVDDDYDSMGTESGQPGRYNNFDANMDVNAYLISFCATKYPDAATGHLVEITYKFYASGATTDQVKLFEKTASGWALFEAFTANISYTLVTEDYDSMGTTSGTPGRYDNFDANMDVDHYLTNFLRLKFPYAVEGNTATVTYKYYASSVTSDRNSIYKYDGSAWVPFDPYADTLDVIQKTAEMEYNGSTWVLNRLMGGSLRLELANEHYAMLYNWVKENKDAKYLSTMNSTDEYYTGASFNPNYNNINNNYNTWKTHYNVGNIYDGLTNEQIQEIMDANLAEGIIAALLPTLISAPDSGLTYVVVYKIYAGRGDGFYKMSFVYDEESGLFELVSGVSKDV